MTGKAERGPDPPGSATVIAQMGSLASNWMTDFCGRPVCSDQAVLSCVFKEIFDSSTCVNHLLVTGIGVLLILVLALQLLLKIRERRSSVRQLVTPSSSLQLAAVVFNGFLGLVYLVLGLSMLDNIFSRDAYLYLPHWWLVTLSQGFSLIISSFAFSIRPRFLGASFIRSWSVLLTIYAAFICCSSVVDIVVEKAITVKPCLDLLSLPGAFLLLLHGIHCSHDEEGYQATPKAMYRPLNTGADSKIADSDSKVSPLAKAGLFSNMSFWWLNDLMKMGYVKPLEDKDVPLLQTTDRAHNQYLMFLEKLNNKQSQSLDTPSILWTIVSCHRREIFVSGFFALLKVLTISTGPILLKAFIDISLGKGTFKYEGFVLAATMFVCKCCESLSQRQWYFRTQRLGLQVRSFLSAAIYKKQQKLSNSAKMRHSSGQIMNYVTVDAYRIGEFPYWFHQTWTTSVQLCIALAILYNAVGAASASSLAVIIVTVLANAPLAKLQHKFQSKLMEAQDVRLKAMSESLVHMKILKLYAWETHFKKVIEGFREVEYKWLSAFLLRRAYNSSLFWSTPVLVSAATFLTCYLLKIPLDASNVFTTVATLRLVQDPLRMIPDVIAVLIQAKVAFTRISKFLDAPELNGEVRKKYHMGIDYPVAMNSCGFSWDENSSKPTLNNINLVVKAGQKIAICGEVGSGKSTLLAAVLGEVPKTEGTIQVCGEIAYVSQNAWIQTGTVQENILFGSVMDRQKYQETLVRCSLVKDFEMLPFGDLTQIGERGVNLSGGQKQRVQLARALYQNADIYLLDDPFSAVDAHTATSLFNEYVMSALADKTVLLVTHQVDFLPIFDSILLMSNGEVIQSAPYQDLLADCQEFKYLVNAHEDTVGVSDINNMASHREKEKIPTKETYGIHEDRYIESVQPSPVDQLIRREERESGDAGLKPYMLYLRQNKGFLYASLCVMSHLIFLAGQISQNSWMAANVQNPHVTTLKLISVYIGIGICTMFFVLTRSLIVVVLGVQTSRSLFSQLLNSLFRAPMSFFDSTPLGRVLSRVSSDLSIIDVDVPFAFMFGLSSSLNAYSNLGVIVVVTWQVLFVSVPMIVFAIRLQRYYLASAKELMRINGTTKSTLANHLGESISGAITIRAFGEEDRFFAQNLELVDKNAGAYFYNFAATEWLIQRLEIMSAAVISSSAFFMALLPLGTFGAGFVGMSLSYGLSLNNNFVTSIQKQCDLANKIISVERVNQYINIQSEAAEVIEENRPVPDWPQVGRVEIKDLKIRYRRDAPLVLHGITCNFEGRDKIGIVGRTGSGKTTLIGALFRLVEPSGGTICIDSVDITTLGLHDLRSRLGIIPQEPTLFQGTVRYNLDPLGKSSDQEIWEVLGKCQLLEAIQDNEQGLDSLVAEDGSNWSMGQRQLFCLGRALLRRCRILVLDEATASIDNATDAVLQKTIRTEFRHCTVITVAHRIPTVMDCDMVLAMSDGQVVEYDKPKKLMETEGSLFRELVNEYWSYTSNGNI